MIRVASSDDAEAIAALEQVCFADSWSVGLIVSGLTSPYDHYLILEKDGALIGYGALRTIADESEVHRIAVHPSCRRRGYARELLEQMVCKAMEHQAHSVILEVRPSNLAAMSLYKSFNFREEGRRREYYQNPIEDAALMRLALA